MGSTRNLFTTAFKPPSPIDLEALGLIMEVKLTDALKSFLPRRLLVSRR